MAKKLCKHMIYKRDTYIHVTCDNTKKTYHRIKRTAVCGIHMKIHTQVCAVIAEFIESLPAKTQRTSQENGNVKIRLHLQYHICIIFISYSRDMHDTACTCRRVCSLQVIRREASKQWTHVYRSYLVSASVFAFFRVLFGRPQAESRGKDVCSGTLVAERAQSSVAGTYGVVTRHGADVTANTETYHVVGAIHNAVRMHTYMVLTVLLLLNLNVCGACCSGRKY